MIWRKLKYYIALPFILIGAFTLATTIAIVGGPKLLEDVGNALEKLNAKIQK